MSGRLKTRGEALVEEMRACRERYVETQVSRQLDHREGDMTRAQIDDAIIAARLGWDQRYPVMAEAIKRGVES